MRDVVRWRTSVFSQCRSGARADQAGLVGEDHGLYPVPEVQLGEQVTHVGLHGGFTHPQFLGDLGVRLAPGDLYQYLALTVGERRQIAWWSGVRVGKGVR